jgi:hypothetical protein
MPQPRRELGPNARAGTNLKRVGLTPLPPSRRKVPRPIQEMTALGALPPTRLPAGRFRCVPLRGGASNASTAISPESARNLKSLA